MERAGAGGVGASVVIRGTVTANEDVTLTGRVEGTIQIPNHVVTIGPEARIEGEIRAKAIVVLGAVTGDVQATDKVILGAGGALDGDIRAPRVEIRDGARFGGRIEMPARIRAVTAA